MHGRMVFNNEFPTERMWLTGKGLDALGMRQRAKPLPGLNFKKAKLEGKKIGKRKLILGCR